VKVPQGLKPESCVAVNRSAKALRHPKSCATQQHLPRHGVNSSVVGQFEKHVLSAAKAAIDFEAFTARLKPRRFKTNSN
jgi:hypothetical protein